LYDSLGDNEDWLELWCFGLILIGEEGSFIYELITGYQKLLNPW